MKGCETKPMRPMSGVDYLVHYTDPWNGFSDFLVVHH